MNRPQVPPALLSAIERDLRPVRPLASPAHRALGMLPVGLLLLIGMPAFWIGLGRAKLAPSAGWAFSALESGLSLIVLAGAFREAVPGRELSSTRLWALAGLACIAFLLANATIQSPGPVPLQTWLHWFRGCIYMVISFSIPALLAPAWLVSRALPNRPALTGALCGAGVGLMADAGLRLTCWDGGFVHALLAHGAAIALLTVLGAASATAVERLKSSDR